MDISVWLLVLIAAGAAVAGGLITLAWTRHSRRASRVAHGQMREALSSAETELDDAAASARRELERANKLQLEADTAGAEVRRLQSELDAMAVERDRERDLSRATRRRLDDITASFTDIAGLESEIGLLRAVAAKVPRLEAEIDRLVAAESTTIDLRVTAPDPADTAE